MTTSFEEQADVFIKQMDAYHAHAGTISIARDRLKDEWQAMVASIIQWGWGGSEYERVVERRTELGLAMSRQWLNDAKRAFRAARVMQEPASVQQEVVKRALQGRVGYGKKRVDKALEVYELAKAGKPKAGKARLIAQVRGVFAQLKAMVLDNWDTITLGEVRELFEAELSQWEKELSWKQKRLERAKAKEDKKLASGK
jgi:hypothetical protein